MCKHWTITRKSQVCRTKWGHLAIFGDFGLCPKSHRTEVTVAREAGHRTKKKPFFLVVGEADHTRFSAKKVKLTTILMESGIPDCPNQ